MIIDRNHFSCSMRGELSQTNVNGLNSCSCSGNCSNGAAIRKI
jgi:hypothetical protein